MKAPTIATFPVRVKLQRDQTLRTFLQDLQAQSATLLELEHYGMQNIRSLSEDARIACDVQSLLLVEYDSEEAHSRLLQETRRRAGVAFHSFAFGLRCTIANQKHVTLEVNWDETVLSYERVQLILSQLQHVVERVFSISPSSRVKDIDLVGAADLATLAQWNAISPIKQSDCLHRRFEQIACMYPSNIAVDSWDGKLTYRELDVKSTPVSYTHLTLPTICSV